jgi:hypothetical protein
MKKAAVATTTASGAAVSSSRIKAVQSVYIAGPWLGTPIIPAIGGDPPEQGVVPPDPA